MTNNSGAEYRVLLAEITRVVGDKTSTIVNDRIVLRDAVCAYVAAEHARGTPLQGVIQTVRQILRKAEEGTATVTDELARQLIDWCLEFHPEERLA